MVKCNYFIGECYLENKCWRQNDWSNPEKRANTKICYLVARSCGELVVQPLVTITCASTWEKIAGVPFAHYVCNYCMQHQTPPRNTIFVLLSAIKLSALIYIFLFILATMILTALRKLNFAFKISFIIYYWTQIIILCGRVSLPCCWKIKRNIHPWISFCFFGYKKGRAQNYLGVFYLPYYLIQI